MKKGFTLIEMVMVMGIIVVLFLLTLPNIQRTLSVVNEKGCEAQLKVVDAAILQWQLKNDAIPGSVDVLISEGFMTPRQAQCSDGTPIRVSNGQASR